MINKFFFTIFHWQGFHVHVDDQQVSLDKFRLLKINNILATFSLLFVYTSKFLTWQFFLVKEKLARQIFLDKENLSTSPHLHEQFFLVKANLSRKNCSCKSGLNMVPSSPEIYDIQLSLYSNHREFTVQYNYLNTLTELIQIVWLSLFFRAPDGYMSFIEWSFFLRHVRL